eukprot:gene41635-50808_t
MRHLLISAVLLAAAVLICALGSEVVRQLDTVGLPRDPTVIRLAKLPNNPNEEGLVFITELNSLVYQSIRSGSILWRLDADNNEELVDLHFAATEGDGVVFCLSKLRRQDNAGAALLRTIQSHTGLVLSEAPFSGVEGDCALRPAPAGTDVVVVCGQGAAFEVGLPPSSVPTALSVRSVSSTSAPKPQARSDARESQTSSDSSALLFSTPEREVREAWGLVFSQRKAGGEVEWVRPEGLAHTTRAFFLDGEGTSSQEAEEATAAGSWLSLLASPVHRSSEGVAVFVVHVPGASAVRVFGVPLEGLGERAPWVLELSLHGRGEVRGVHSAALQSGGVAVLVDTPRGL